MNEPGMRLGFADLVGAGGRAVSRYTGTLFVVFVVQSLVALACMLGVALVLANTFAHLPLFDEAVDGGLVALGWSVVHAPTSFLSSLWIVFAALFVWQLITWFLAGGLYGVFALRPDTRTSTARVFGACGSATYLAYARLAACSLVGWAIVAVVALFALARAARPLAEALTVGELIAPLALVIVPTGLLAHYVATVTDYARAELTLRHDTHAPGVVMTYLRTLVWVARRPLALAHGALGWILFALITAAYLLLAQGHPMYGAGGAITLFVARSGVALLRMLIRVGVMGGQVELARTRPLPPTPTPPSD